MVEDFRQRLWIGDSPEQAGEFYEQLIYKLTSLEKFQHLIRSSDSATEAMQIGLAEVQHLISLEASGFLLVDEKDGDFQLRECEPRGQETFLMDLINQEIEAGTFAWALRQTRPIIVRNSKTGLQVLFSVLTTRARTFGMFAGVVRNDESRAAEDALGLLSLVLLSVTYTLENHTLVRELRDYNEHLQDLVLQRSAEIVKTNAELQQEIEERRQREKELRLAKGAAEAADRAKSEFLAIMSHEIRTPMNGIIGFTNLLEASTLNDEQQDCVRLLNLSGQQLLCLLNDLLDFSKIDAGQLYLEEHPFNLHDLVHDLIDLTYLRAYEKGIELAVDIFELVPRRLVGDPTRLRQILMNLVTNALKFTAHGEITLKIERDPLAPFLRYKVSDTGIGIAPDKIGKLFQPFTQADSSTTRKFGGTGLGLAICRKLCELMGGEISVQSTLGQGSTFTFCIPIREADELATSPTPRFLEGQMIWVLTPHLLHKNLIAQQLERWGAQVLDPAMGQREKQGNLVVVDAVLFAKHEHGNFSVLRELIGDRAAVVLVSNRAERDRWAPVANSRLQILLKPVRAEQFRITLAKVLGLEANAIHSTVPQTPCTSPLPPVEALDVLLADDNPLNQKIAVQMVRKLGHRPIVVENGEQVLQVLQKGHFDVALLDLEMPVMGGRETTEAIRRGEAGANARTIFIAAITAHAASEERARCLKLGMNDYITKPIQMEQLRVVFSKVSRALTN